MSSTIINRKLARISIVLVMSKNTNNRFIRDFHDAVMGVRADKTMFDIAAISIIKTKALNEENLKYREAINSELEKFDISCDEFFDMIKEV